MPRYFLFAGEASGDLHGSRLIHSLQTLNPSAHFSGVGGPRMRQCHFDCIMEMELFQVMGFSDVVMSLPHLWKKFYEVRNFILRTRPNAVILIDYPGFNLRLARSLRKQGFRGKIVQFICPTIWAHGKERIKTLAAYYDLLLTIYPFEAAYFSQTNLKVEYIGNPLIDAIKTHHYQNDWRSLAGVPHQDNLIALFPGSREGEIHLHLPQQLQAAAKLKAGNPNLIFALSCAQEYLEKKFIKTVQEGPLKLNEDLFIVPPKYNYELMKSATAALAKSGTVTLELALHSTPTVVHYELSSLNYLFAKYFLKLNLPHYCIVNILANHTLFPELIGRRISSSHLQEHLQKVTSDNSTRKAIIKGCEEIKQLLSTSANDQSAGHAIERMLEC